MSDRDYFNLGSSGASSSAVNQLIIITAAISLLSGVLNLGLMQLFGSNIGPQFLFIMTKAGLQMGFIWQCLSYMFVHYGEGGIGLGFLIGLGINLLFLWILAPRVVQQIGSTSFIKLYLGTGALVGLVAATVLLFTPINGVLAGALPPITALLVVWAFLFPEEQMLFFGVFPVQSRWLVVGLIAFRTFIDLSTLHTFGMIVTLASVSCGYLYSLVALNIRGPFEFTHSFDDMVARLAVRWRMRRGKIQGDPSLYHHAKVYDFNTGQPLNDDDDFMDSMLAKISLEGEDSLSKKERKRMDQISQQKRVKL